MKVLCGAKGPVKVGDPCRMQVEQGAVDVRLDTLPDMPGRWPTVTGVAFGSSAVRVAPEKLGLHWEDLPDPAPVAELTVRDQYVLALLAMMRHAEDSWETTIDTAFELADYCMEKRK